MVQWVKREATVLKDYQDWKDHPDLRDLKAKLVPHVPFLPGTNTILIPPF